MVLILQCLLAKMHMAEIMEEGRQAKAVDKMKEVTVLTRNSLVQEIITLMSLIFCGVLSETCTAEHLARQCTDT